MIYYTEQGLYEQGDCCIAFGMFDGVHLAHQKLLKSCAQYAKAQGLSSFAYTYTGLPMTKYQGKEIPLLCSQQERIVRIQRTGIQHIVIMEFTSEYAHTSAEDFIARICQKRNVRAIFCGFDYHFGAFGKGSTELLEKRADQYGYRLFVMNEVLYHGEKISSTRIRNAIQQGNYAEAKEMLGL